MDEKPTLDYENPTKSNRKSFWDGWSGTILAAMIELGLYFFSMVVLPLAIIYFTPSGCWRR